jgi:hypothetical protein
MHVIYLSVSLLPTTIDPVEQEREQPSEPAPVEDTNPSKIKASLSASNHIP